MNPLRDDKAPYALALLLGAFGWHVSQITTEVKRSNTIAYTVSNDAKKRQQTIRIDNLSNDKSIAEMNFQLHCPDSVDCLVDVRQKVVGITLIPSIICRDSQTDARFRIALPPQSSVKIISDITAGQNFPKLYFRPTNKMRCFEEADKTVAVSDEFKMTEPVVMLNGNSWRVFMAKNYMSLILTSFTLTLLILLSVIFSVFRSSGKPTAPDNEENDNATAKDPAHA